MTPQYNFPEVQTVSFHSSRLRARFEWADLLGRRASSFAPSVIPSIQGRRVLVTGAGGFIGSAIVRLLAASGAAEIVLLEVAEGSLFAIWAERSAAGDGARCIPILGSICDQALVDELFREHRPEMVLHAAALKHVPLMEQNPLAAIETNSLGTRALAEAAAAHGSAQIILVSTDKVVVPHSIMGASKRIAELATLALPPTCGRVVRLANVIGSPGSVGPLFAAQIARGGPLTVTHPEARRFFLTLDEVVHLLSQAMQMNEPGIFIPDPGEAILITDLAQRMLAASGSDLPVAFTGTRPGDKLDETLLSPAERVDAEAAPGLRRIVSPMRADLAVRMDELAFAVADRDLPRVLRIVQELVPDYQPSALIAEAAAVRS